ncbi:hypothetical protein N9X60_00580 [Paracoccaceae bacterium]|nr:hypothetical protein [Paracoccaceae bacterium]
MTRAAVYAGAAWAALSLTWLICTRFIAIYLRSCARTHPRLSHYIPLARGGLDGPEAAQRQLSGFGILPSLPRGFSDALQEGGR